MMMMMMSDAIKPCDEKRDVEELIMHGGKKSYDSFFYRSLELNDSVIIEQPLDISIYERNINQILTCGTK